MKAFVAVEELFIEFKVPEKKGEVKKMSKMSVCLN